VLESLTVTGEPPTGVRVGIIGLGYVGFPLATAFATAHTAIDVAMVVEHVAGVVDLRNGVRRRLTGRDAGALPLNVDVV
jgi:UDP-N-acetyl-D-mannosaminuronate dehydrogenase